MKEERVEVWLHRTTEYMNKRLTTQRVFQLCRLGRYSGRKTIEWGDCSPVKADIAVYSVLILFNLYFPIENNRWETVYNPVRQKTIAWAVAFVNKNALSPTTQRISHKFLLKSGPQRLRFMLNIVCLNWNINKSKRVASSHQTLNNLWCYS